MSFLLRLTAVVEGSTGLSLLLTPSLLTGFLFGKPVDTALLLVACRLAGAALLSLAWICWWAGASAATRTARVVMAAMLLYNAIATGVLAYAGLLLALAGAGLWPAIAVHAGLAIWCLLELLRRNTPVTRAAIESGARD